MAEDYDEDAHPRDEQGRFSSGGGGGGSKKEGGAALWASNKLGGAGRQGARAGARAREDLKQWAKARAGERAPKEEHKPKGESAPKREWTDTQLAGKSKETWQDHFNGHPDAGGKPTVERAAMHEEKFVKPAFDGKKAAKEIGYDKPIAILTMGGPASGKGTVLSQLEKKGLDRSHYVHVDPDEVKSNLPEYTKSVPQPAHKDKDGNHVPGKGGIHGDGTGPTAKGAAAQVHEESSYVAKQMEAKALAGGHNVIVDGTGGNAASFVEKIKKFQEAGYHVEVHYPHLDKDEGIKRALSRAEGSGRYVPEDVIRGTYDKIEASRDRIVAVAPNLKVYDGHSKHAEAYKHNESSTSPGTPAKPLHGRSPMQAIESRRRLVKEGMKMGGKKLEGLQPRAKG